MSKSSTATNTAPAHAIRIVTDDTLAELLRGAEVPVFVDFYADWCGPCRLMSPILEAFAREHQGEVVVAKLDTDANPLSSMAYGIRGIPKLVAFDKGAEVDRQVGAGPKSYLEAMLAEIREA